MKVISLLNIHQSHCQLRKIQSKQLVLKDSASSASQSAAVQNSSSTKTNAVTRETSQKDIVSSKAMSGSANIQSSTFAVSISSQSIAKSSKVVSSSVSAKPVETHKTTTLAAQPAAVSAKTLVANTTSTDSTPSNTSKGHATSPTHNTTTPVVVNDHELQNVVNSAKKFGAKITKDPTREGTVESNQVKEAQKWVQKDYQNQIAVIQNAEMEQSKYNTEYTAQIKAHDAAVAQNEKIDAVNKLAQANYQK